MSRLIDCGLIWGNVIFTIILSCFFPTGPTSNFNHTDLSSPFSVMDFHKLCLLAIIFTKSLNYYLSLQVKYAGTPSICFVMHLNYIYASKKHFSLKSLKGQISCGHYLPWKHTTFKTSATIMFKNCFIRLIILHKKWG